MTEQRPFILLLLGWLWIVAGSFGGIMNAYGIFVNAPPYPQWLWVALLLSKLGSVAAGVLLLRMQKLAAWVYAATAIYGWIIALGFSNFYTPVSDWRYVIGLVVLVIYAAVIWRYWNTLQPQRGVVGNISNA